MAWCRCSCWRAFATDQAGLSDLHHPSGCSCPVGQVTLPCQAAAAAMQPPTLRGAGLQCKRPLLNGRTCRQQPALEGGGRLASVYTWRGTLIGNAVASREGVLSSCGRLHWRRSIALAMRNAGGEPANNRNKATGQETLPGADHQSVRYGLLPSLRCSSAHF